MGMKTNAVAASIMAALALTPKLVEKIEGIEYRVYYDIAGVPTVCSGITGKDVVIGKVYTRGECDALLLKHIKIASDYVDSVVKSDIPPSMRAALYSFTFNVGRGAFGGSSMLKEVNAGHYQKACDKLFDWVYYTDKKTKKKVFSKGLKNRRTYEYQYCTKELK